MGRLRWIVAAVATALSVVAMDAAPARADRATVDGCERTTSTVHLSPTDPASYSVAGWLCGPRTNTEVQLLLHGFSYNHLYWTGLDAFQTLDYVAAAVATGGTTFAIDQVGTGLSGHPSDPENFTFTRAAYVIHQLVGQLRSGAIGQSHQPYSRVIGVGHSMGARTLIMEAGTYADLNAVVALDATHASSPTGTAAVTAATIVANTLPQFAGLPAGYLTVTPRTVFHAAEDGVDVVAQDDAVKDTGAAGMLSTIADARNPAYSDAITAPVLVAVGQDDALSCDETVPGVSCATPTMLLNREKPYFPSTTCFDVLLTRGGHSTNLNPQAAALFSYVKWWLDQIRSGATGPALSVASPNWFADDPCI